MTAQLCLPLDSTYSNASDRKIFFSEEMRKILDKWERQEQPPMGDHSKKCCTNLYCGFFFDGTKNNYTLAEKTKTHSNVARLYDCFPGQSVSGVLPASTDWQYNRSRYMHFFRTYIPGVGTPFREVLDSGEEMKACSRSTRAWLRLLFAGWVLSSVLSACGKSGAAAPATGNVPVSVHAVNYSNEEFEYSVQDPLDKANAGGGESIGRYAAGGTMCCYGLPQQWRPGLKVKLEYVLYFPDPVTGDIPTTHNAAIIDIPQYAKPEEMWVVRDEQGVMNVILSNVQPDHPKWPGAVKGWPVPTLAYYRERADIEINGSKGYINALQELYDGMRTTPDQTAKEIWENAEKYKPKEIAGYSGYLDKKYHDFLLADLSKSLKEEKENLKKLEAARP